MSVVTLDSLTDAERAEVAKGITDYHGCGWEQVDQAEKRGRLYAPGVRIRHVGQQYPEAYRFGAGVIVVVLKRFSAVELIVAYDKPRFTGGSRIAQIGNYHVDLGPFEKVA